MSQVFRELCGEAERRLRTQSSPEAEKLRTDLVLLLRLFSLWEKRGFPPPASRLLSLRDGLALYRRAMELTVK